MAPPPPKSRIVGTGRYTPAKIVTNRDLESVVDTTDAWIRERTGIGERRVAADGETTHERDVSLAELALRPIDVLAIATASDAAGQTGFPELSRNPREVLSEFRRLHGFKPGYREFLDWYRKVLPGDYSAVFR